MFDDISLVSEDLKDKFPDLTSYEALQIACQMENIQAFKDAFMVNPDAKTPYPVALEAISMALGFEYPMLGGSSLVNAISAISERK